MFKFGRIKPYDTGDYNIESSRDLLEEIRDKLYAQCGDTDPNPLKVELCGSINNLLQTLDTFQLRDCDGGPIGPAQIVTKTVVLNKQIVKICNVQELAAAIALAITTGSAELYNTPDCIVVAPGSSHTVAAGDVHSLSYKISGGTGTMQIGAGAIIPLTDGEADGWEATTTLAVSFQFAATTGTIKIISTKA